MHLRARESRFCSMTMDAGKSAHERARQIELKAEGLFRRDYPTGSFARRLPQIRSSCPRSSGRPLSLRALWDKSRFCLESRINPHVETDAVSARPPTFV